MTYDGACENRIPFTNDGEETLGDLLEGSSITQLPVNTIVQADSADGVTNPVRCVSPLAGPTAQRTPIVFTNATHGGLEHS